MLDDPKLIAQRDPQDFLGSIAGQPEQLRHDFGLTTNTIPSRDIHNVVFASLGGSALAAGFMTTWPAPIPVPMTTWKNYDLPDFVDEHSLVICSSYSGNTEETISSFEAALARKAQIVVVASGGKLLELAKSRGCVYAMIPECRQPRASAFYMYRATLEVLVAAKLVPATTIAEMMAATAHLEVAINNWTATVPEASNQAKQLAQEMIGKTVIIYAGPNMAPAAYKWKIGVNENAKNTAWCGVYPEFNHNEFIGWSSHPVEKPFAVIDLISQFERPRILERLALSDRMLSGQRPKAMTIEAQGANILEHMLYLVLLGDFATTYMGLLNGVNPTPVALVEKFKKALS